MFCGNCGKKIPDNVKFCPFCGNKNEKKSEIGQLVLDAAAGKSEAIEKIYHMTYAQGFAVAMQMVKNEQDAMDLLQDAYISAFQNLNKLNRPEAFRSWFNCIVANNCRDWIRKKKPDLFCDINTGEEQGEFEDSLESDCMEFSPEEYVDYSETKRLMNEILQNLPEDQRLCVLMYYYDELSVNEIAEALDCSSGTVKSRLNYARKKIKDEVEGLAKKGTKLYGIAPIPFLVWMLRETASRTSVSKECVVSLIKELRSNSFLNPIVEAESKEVLKEAGRKAGKALTKKTIAIRTIAGIVGAVVVGTVGAVSIDSVRDYLEEKKVEKKETQEQGKFQKEEEKEFGDPKLLQLSDEEKGKIVSAAFAYDEKHELEEPMNGRKEYQINTADISGEELSRIAGYIGYSKLDGVELDLDDVAVEGVRKRISAENAEKLLEETFGYSVSGEEDIANVFEKAGENEYILNEGYHGSASTMYSSLIAYQTGENEYHFYIGVKPWIETGYTTTAIMDITARKNGKSLIAGFVFEKIHFTKIVREAWQNAYREYILEREEENKSS